MLTEKQLAAACLALIGGRARLSSVERKVRKAIERGEERPGQAFSSLRSAAVRRAAGAIYTPAPIVHSMMSWLAAQGQPARIVDPGAGSGRFIMAAARKFPESQLVPVEQDPPP